MWGGLSLYFPLLEPAGAVEIIAHRVLWSMLLCLVLLIVTKQWGAYVKVLRSRRLMLVLSAAAVLVGANWLTFVFAVTSGHVIDASLGYFINPMVTVLLAVVILKERLRPVQWVAIGFGTSAVVVIAAGLGSVPWVALTLAFTFGLYGLVKNLVGREVTALPGLAVETTILVPIALIYLGWLTLQGTSTFLHDGVGHTLLLMSSGIVTAVPLLLFSAAARTLPLSTIGMLQYIGPLLQFLSGVLIFHEQMPTVRWVGFGLVWVALIILTSDALRSLRATKLSRRPLSDTVA